MAKRQTIPEVIVTDLKVPALMTHWQPLLNMISLVEPPHLKKALREWVNKNQNCAYTMKLGACDMSCDECPNDITIEHIITVKDIKTKNTKGVKNEKRMSKMSES